VTSNSCNQALITIPSSELIPAFFPRPSMPLLKPSLFAKFVMNNLHQWVRFAAQSAEIKFIIAYVVKLYQNSTLGAHMPTEQLSFRSRAVTQMTIYGMGSGGRRLRAASVVRYNTRIGVGFSKHKNSETYLRNPQDETTSRKPVKERTCRTDKTAKELLCPGFVAFL
jgi:hypothetical protein